MHVVWCAKNVCLQNHAYKSSFVILKQFCNRRYVFLLRFGSEQANPKTVIAPEALYKYEQEAIRKAQEESLKTYNEENDEDDEDSCLEPEDPQVWIEWRLTFFIGRDPCKDIWYWTFKT